MTRFNYRVVKFYNEEGKEVDCIEYNNPMSPKEREALKMFLALNYHLSPGGCAEVIKYNK